MQFSYFAYGLAIGSNQPIPGLSETLTVSPDIQVHLGVIPVWFQDLPEWINPTCRTTSTIKQIKNNSYWYFAYSDGTDFLISQTGTEIWATWVDPLTLEDTVTYLLGPILGFVLRLRGTHCLHASAIALGDWAIALVGSAGAGKSTTAAAFAQRGYPILSDDVLALVNQEDLVWIQPAYPRLRLWPAAVKVLYGEPDALPRLTPNWDKCYLGLNQDHYQFQQSPLPIAAIYLLHPRQSDPTAPFIVPLTPQRALMELITNTYANTLLSKTMRAQEFELLSHLVNKIPVQSVVPHANPQYLPKLCDLILEHFQSLPD